MPQMRKFRLQIESILKKNFCTLDMPLKPHALRRARECISIGDVTVMSILAIDLSKSFY